MSQDYYFHGMTPDEAAFILDALAQQPLARVLPLWSRLRDQFDKQARAVAQGKAQGKFDKPRPAEADARPEPDETSGVMPEVQVGGTND